MINADKGQIFSGSAGRATEQSQDAPSFQPATALPDEGRDYNALTFDLAAAGFQPVDWSRPKSDLRFTMRQTTLPEYCRAIRLTLVDGGLDGARLLRALLRIAIVQIGDNKTPSDDQIDAWLEDLHASGVLLVDKAYNHICYPSEALNKAFDGSRKFDPGRRCYTFKVPRAALPTKVAASFPEEQLSFSMRELGYGEMSTATDACDDPDDGAACKTMRMMWAICEIGGRALGHSPADLLHRRQWLASLGHMAFLMISGTWTKLHEVDRGLVDRFLGTAVAS